MPRVTLVNWDNLRYFLELVRAGTLLAAARRLGVDYSTLSRRILALEKEVGSQLFERRASGYHLTEPGKRLLVHVEAIESSALAIERAVSGRNARISGHVRIGAKGGFGCTHAERKDIARVRVVWDYIKEVTAHEQPLLRA